MKPFGPPWITLTGGRSQTIRISPGRLAFFWVLPGQRYFFGRLWKHFGSRFTTLRGVVMSPDERPYDHIAPPAILDMPLAATPQFNHRMWFAMAGHGRSITEHGL